MIVRKWRPNGPFQFLYTSILSWCLKLAEFKIHESQDLCTLWNIHMTKDVTFTIPEKQNSSYTTNNSAQIALTFAGHRCGFGSLYLWVLECFQNSKGIAISSLQRLRLYQLKQLLWDFLGSVTKYTSSCCARLLYFLASAKNYRALFGNGCERNVMSDVIAWGQLDMWCVTKYCDWLRHDAVLFFNV